MAPVITVVPAVLALATDVLDFVVANPILVFIFAASLIPIGFRIFRGAKRSAY